MLKRQKSQVSHFDFADFPTVFSWLCLHVCQCVDGNHSKGERDDMFRFEKISTSELQNQRLHLISLKDLCVQVEGQSTCSQSMSTTEAMSQWISNKLPWLVTLFDSSWRFFILAQHGFMVARHLLEHLQAWQGAFGLFLTAAILVWSRFRGPKCSFFVQLSPRCHLVSLPIFHCHRMPTWHQNIEISLHAEVRARCQYNFGENISNYWPWMALVVSI